MSDAATDDDIARWQDMADGLTDEMVEDILDAGEIPAEVLFSLWVNLTHILAAGGWSLDELTRELVEHATIATTEGPA